MGEGGVVEMGEMIEGGGGVGRWGNEGEERRVVGCGWEIREDGCRK